jgi:hypothetical protein
VKRTVPELAEPVHYEVALPPPALCERRHRSLAQAGTDAAGAALAVFILGIGVSAFF